MRHGNPPTTGAPSMTLGAPTVTNLSVSQPFTTYDTNGDAVTVTADWGDGATGTVTSPAAHTYATASVYEATFTPNDGALSGAVRRIRYRAENAPGPGVLMDSFNRANSTTSLGNLDTGQTWVQTGTGKVGILDGRAYRASSFATALVDFGAVDMKVSVKVVVTADYFAGPRARASLVDGSSYNLDTGAGGLVAKVSAAPVGGGPGYSLGGSALPIGSGDTIGLSCKEVTGGTEVTLWIGGEPIKTYPVDTRADRPMGTYAGISPYNSGTIRLDDFRVEAP